MTLEPFLGAAGIIGTVAFVVALCMWFSLTLFILCIMEVGHLSFHVRAERAHFFR